MPSANFVSQEASVIARYLNSQAVSEMFIADIRRCPAYIGQRLNETFAVYVMIPLSKRARFLGIDE